MNKNLIERFNNDDERRIWIAAFQSECARHITRDIAERVADISVLAYRERVFGTTIPIPD